MGTTSDDLEIIVLSDDDDECEEASLLIVEVEDKKNKHAVAMVSSAPLDEDLVVTFSRRAELLPHARYDCPVHAFTPTDEVGSPVSLNQAVCEQCFCYICDKLASLCEVWCHRGTCHCNSHKKSDFWNNLRNNALLGRLNHFNFSLSEVDTNLWEAEKMLQTFRQELAVHYAAYLMGIPRRSANKEEVLHDYTPVFDFVTSFLAKASQQDGRAAAVMYLGAAEDFMRHQNMAGVSLLPSRTANVGDAKKILLQRAVQSVRRLMVMSDFTPDFFHKLQSFYSTLSLPPELKRLRSSLTVRPWDDVLLVSVLKGQNVVGVRKDKGKKDVLIEQMSVVVHRTELLQQQHRYRELCRYLHVVQTDEPTTFQRLHDLIPFFMCLDGGLPAALDRLNPGANSPASRLTPPLFLIYLHVFRTATAPKRVITGPTQLVSCQAPWEAIDGAVPLKHLDLVKFALKVHRCCPQVYFDSKCWVDLLSIVHTTCFLQRPDPNFIHEISNVVTPILLDEFGANVQIPRWFTLSSYPQQALLLLVTEALRLRIHHTPLSPLLPVLNTFEVNPWALRWLWERLCSSSSPCDGLLQAIQHEMQNTRDKNDSLLFVRSYLPILWSLPEYMDQPLRGDDGRGRRKRRRRKNVKD